MDHLISARQPDLVIVNKKKKRPYWIVDFTIPADHWVKLKESEKKDKHLDLTREQKITEHESDSNTNCYWLAQYSHQRNWYRDWRTWK